MLQKYCPIILYESNSLHGMGNEITFVSIWSNIFIPILLKSKYFCSHLYWNLWPVTTTWWRHMSDTGDTGDHCVVTLVTWPQHQIPTHTRHNTLETVSNTAHVSATLLSSIINIIHVYFDLNRNQGSKLSLDKHQKSEHKPTNPWCSNIIKGFQSGIR